MGRLENIIARNRRPNQLRERVIVSLVFGAIVLLIIVLATFTDLGRPPDARNAGQPPGAPEGSGRVGPPGRAGHGERVDGVLLRAAPATRPAR